MRLEKAGQHIRWIAQTSGHYLLIPVYAVYQATRVLGKQLAGQGNPSESPGKTLGTAESNAGTVEPNPTRETDSGDRAIARVLSGVEVWALSQATTNAGESWQVTVTEQGNSPQLEEKAVLGLTSKGMGLRERVLNGIPGRILARFGLSSDRPGTLVPVASTQGSVTVATAASAIAPSRPVIQGIATLVETRTLVLISDRNQILNILTPVQQQQLQARIEGELAAVEYHFKPQLLRSTATNSALSGSESRKQLSPVQGLRQLFAGVEPVPVGNLLDRSWAKVGDLLQPSPLVLQPDGVREVPETKLIAPSRHLPKIDGAFLVMDAAVARLEGMQFPPGGTLTRTVAEGSESIVQGIQKMAIALVTDPPQDTSPSGLSKAHPSFSLRMHLLIQEGVDYFFGASDHALTGGSDRLSPVSAQQAAPRSSQSKFPGKKLPQNSVIVKPLPLESKAAIGQLPRNPELNKRPTSAWEVQAVEEFVTPPPPTRTGRSPQASASLRSKSAQSNRARVQQQRSVIGKTVTPTPAVSVEPTPRVNTTPPPVSSKAKLPPQVQNQPKTDWIDVEIAEFEYIMHPLEQGLKWFDRILVWLEEKLIQGWQWARQQLFS